MTSPAPSIFLSYGSGDRAAARHVYKLLSSAGADVWFDETQLIPGTPWRDSILNALKSVNTLMVLVSQNSIEKMQGVELKTAVEKTTRDPKFRIIPVLLPHTEIEKLHPVLRGLQAVDLRDAADDETRLRRLLASIAIDRDAGETANDEEIGDNLREAGDLSAARPFYEKALSIMTATFGESHPNIGRLHRKLGSIYFEQGDLVSAERYFRSALTIDELAFGSDHQTVAADLNNLGLVYSARGESDRAVATLQRSLEITKEAFGENSHEFATALNNVALVMHARGNLDEAMKYLKESLLIAERISGPAHPDVANRLNNIAGLLHDSGEFEEARVYSEEALKRSTEIYGETHPKVGSRLHNLGTICRELNDLPKAQAYLERALSIAEKNGAMQDVALTLNSLANVYRAKGDISDALALYERSLKIADTIYGPENPLARNARASIRSIESTES